MMRATWLLFALLAAAGCYDAVHDQEVGALGSDPAPAGPQHRPGQPCLVCHGGSGPASLQLSVGGTVYDTQGQTAPSSGTVVTIEDIDGVFFDATTNEAGNFFTTQSEFVPHYPIQMTVTSADGTVQQSMLTHSSREGSCAACHQATPGPSSPGPVYLNTAKH
jgi:hypothetical protein